MKKALRPTEPKREKTTYYFKVALKAEDDGRWSAWIEELPGCAAWGWSQEEALSAIQDATEAYIEDMIEAGETLPIPPKGKRRVVLIEAPVVQVSI